MLIEDNNAQLLTPEESSPVGLAAAWLPSDIQEADEFCARTGLHRLSTASNGPWSGVFVGRGSGQVPSFEPMNSTAVIIAGERHQILVQTTYEIGGTRGFQLGQTAFGTAAFGGGTPGRWVVEYTGDGDPPSALTARPAADEEASASSEVVARTDTASIQLASIDVVERLAERMEDTADSEGERATARVIKEYMNVLRAFVNGDAPDSLAEATLTNLRHLGERLKALAAWYSVGKAILDVVSRFPG